MTPSTSQKVHLRKSSTRTACGLPYGPAVTTRGATAHRVTTVLTRVTCQACSRSLYMADQEIVSRRRGRRA